MANPSDTPRGILLLSAGAKVAIARIAKKSALRRGLSLHITDCVENIPTRHVADAFATLPPSDHPDWATELVAYCENHGIGLVIPTRHSDLSQLSRVQPILETNGTAVSLSAPETLQICIQKEQTHEFLSTIGIPCPTTTTKRELPTSPLNNTFPLFAKPSTGAAALGARSIENEAELNTVPEDWILQPLLIGQEYTVNIYLSKDGSPICLIPHQRIHVESGEVTQARTHRLPALIELCRQIAEQLPGAQGILNIQAFHNPQTDSIQILEINPRIGGGYPLCDAAKGTYIEWMLQEHIDRKPIRPFDAWTENLLMMRYRDAVFSL